MTGLCRFLDSERKISLEDINFIPPNTNVFLNNLDMIFLSIKIAYYTFDRQFLDI